MKVGRSLTLKFCLVIVVIFVVKNFETHFTSNKDFLKGPSSNTIKDNWNQNETLSRQKYFPDDCRCQSLFTINACNESRPVLNISDYLWQNINKDIHRFRSGESVILGDIMTNIARYIPHAYRVKINGTVDIKFTAEELKKWRKGKFQEVKHVNITPLNVTKIKSFSSCDVHLYSSRDIKRCTSLFNGTTGKLLRIAFVGDSLIRSMMEELVDYTYKDLNLTFFNSSFKLNVTEQFLNNKVKYNIPLVGNGLEVRFYWAPYLENYKNDSEQGAKDVLESWVNNSEISDPIPDILYIGGGLWDGITQSGVEATDQFIARMKSIHEILEKLSKTVRIIWHMHPFVKGFAASVIIPSGTLEMMNQLSWLKLKQSNIWMWESLAILTIKEYKECEYYVKANLLKYIPRSWKCADPQHPGEMARKIGMNMIWNLSCNRILGIKKGMCCS